MIKTVVLTGAESAVNGLGGSNVAVKNLSAGTIYASAFPNVTAGADNVAEIPSGGGEIILGANGTIYILGSGKVQCTGTDFTTLNFKQPSSSESGGGGTGDVTKAYVDAQDTTNLGIAKAYTDTALVEAKKYTDEKETALEPATETKLGGVKIGDGLNVETDGKVSAPLATETKITEIVENQTASSSEVDELMSLIFDT